MLRSRACTQLIAATALVLCTAAQSPSENAPRVQNNARVEAEVHHDTSGPLWQMPPAPRIAGPRVHPLRPIPHANGSSVAPAEPISQPLVQPFMPATLLNFSGIGNGFTGPAGPFTVNSAPSDANGSVGPNHYVQIVNTDFAIFNKSGVAIFGPVPVNTLWSGFGGLCQTDNDGDPIVVYDRVADRWVISQFAVTGANGTSVPFLQCVAVSQTPDPTGSYNRYSFGYTGFNDYPKMGVWPDAYYQTFNMFNPTGTSFLGGEVCAYDRSKMLAGLAATQHCFNVGTTYGGLLPANVDSSLAPPSASPNYVLALGPNLTDTKLALWKFHIDWTTPANSTLTGPTTITVAQYTEACNGTTCIPQSGTTQQLDSLADRLMYRLAYRNFGDHESLVVNHSIVASSSVGLRWYEIRSPGSTPVVFQQGTYAPADSNFRWMGSIAMDQSGNMALGFSLSGTAIHPSIAWTGRLASDPLGQMSQGETTFLTGTGSQSGFSGLTRWGDYTAMAVDPADDCTFWYTNQYIPSDGEFNWKTQITSFKFPGCGVALSDFSISATPSSLTVAQGNHGSSTISTAVTSGSASTVNLTVSGIPTGATASFNPTSVTAGNSSTLTVSAGSASPGVYSLTVTGTSSSATHLTPLTLTVTQPPVITSANKATFTVGQSGSFTVTTTGSPTPSITESGALPRGVTFHDNGNGTATLVGTPAAGTGGTYPMTFTAANGVTPNAMQNFTLAIAAVTITPTTVSFNPQTVGTTSLAQGVTFTNIANKTITMNKPTVSGDFVLDPTTTCGTGGTLLANKSCKAVVKFAPTQVGVRTGNLTFTDSDASSPQVVTMQGSGTEATLTPPSTTFSPQPVGVASAAKTFTLKNFLSSVINITNASFSEKNASDFSRTGGTCPYPAGVLAASATCTYLITFKPSSNSAEGPATFTVTTDVAGSPTATLNGAGTIVKLSPTSENFGSVKVGTPSVSKTVTMTNLSAAQDLTITNIALSGPQASDFTIDPSSTCPTGGGTLLHKSTCTVVLKSTPSAPGTRKAAVIFTDVDGGSPQKVSLTTTGI